MSLFRQFLLTTERTHRYRIKTVVPLTDDLMDRLERYLARFNPVDISGVHKTIHQKYPLDFPSVEDREVYIVDVELSIAVSPQVLQQHIYRMFDTADKFVIVHGENDPRELELQRLEAIEEMDQDAEENGKTPAALIDHPDYPEAIEVDPTEYYGDAYNARLVDNLSKIEADTMARYGARNVKQPFDWLKDQDIIEDKDTPKVKAAREIRPASQVGGYGQNYENTRRYRKVYQDGDKLSIDDREVSVTTPKDPS